MESWRLHALRVPLDHSSDDLRLAICKRLRLPPAALLSHRIVKQSVDARQRGNIVVVYALDLELRLDPTSLARFQRRFAKDPHLRPTPDHT